MPLYEYLCESCGHRFEVIRKFSDAPLDACPKCGGRVEKLLSSPAIQFKGSGWYITDYARAGKGGEGTSAGKSDGNSASSGGTGETKTDAKSEPAKTDSATPAKGDKAGASSSTPSSS